MIDPAELRWGRLVEHDPQSRSYAVDEPAAAPADVVWHRWSPILDQGNCGSCTGNAMAGWLGSEPHCRTVGGGLCYDEALAVKIYELATRLDRFPGEYPPDDTGSSGNAAAKAARQLGYIRSWRWAFSTSGLLHALQSSPVLLGVAWREGMMTPDRYGVIHPTGEVLGGHEVLCRGVHGEMLVCDNSWGADWGPLGGSFLLPVDEWAILRDDRADVVAPQLPVVPARIS